MSNQAALADTPRGGRISLNFMNTVNERRGFRAGNYVIDADLFEQPGAVVAWARANGLQVFRCPERQLHQTAVELREVLFRAFRAHILTGFGSNELKRFNDFVHALPARTVERHGDGLRLGWHDQGDPAVRTLAPIIWEAAELLTSPLPDRIKFCAAAECSWIFLDVSKNGLRRWCDMADCGNRAKARRFYRQNR
jgi:predicted RNA-binding Zn ribbon-like protein